MTKIKSKDEIVRPRPLSETQKAMLRLIQTLGGNVISTAAIAMELQKSPMGISQSGKGLVTKGYLTTFQDEDGVNYWSLTNLGWGFAG